MRGVFFLLHMLLFVSLVSAEITVYVSQIPDSSAVRYSVQQRDVSNGRLQLVLKKDSTQLTVTDVQNFNGVASGYFSLQEGGTYKLAALEETTGEYGEAEFEFIPPRPAAPPEEGPGPIVPGVPDYLFWLAMAVAIAIVFLLIFGNPLVQKTK
ncbi:MAG: hypothetical protein AB1657_03910 [Candidatus Micrarchaeota archaeon]